MTARASIAAAGLFFAIALAPGRARAAPLPLSAIPLAAGSIPPASGKSRIDDIRKREDHFVTALDRPVCIQSLAATDRPDWESHPGGGYVDASEGASRLQVDRLAAGAEPFLERVVVDASSSWPEVRVLRRGRVPLARIAGGSLPVYAYRTREYVHLLIPQGFEAAVDAFDRDTPGLFVRASCGMLHVELPIRGGVSQVEVLPARDLPGQERWITDIDAAAEAEGKRFPKGRTSAGGHWTLNASLSKVSRDPEALLSVLVTEPEAPAAR
jgi:hypothetical protein